MKAYKEINVLLYNQYSIDCQKVDFKQNPLNADEDEHHSRVNSFDQFWPILQKIISDSNLIAQYEGLNCLYAYVRFAPDIKQVIFTVNGILLEKIQHIKPNFKDITLKILI